LDDTLGVAQPWPMGAERPPAAGESYSNTPTIPEAYSRREDQEAVAEPAVKEGSAPRPRRAVPSNPDATARPVLRLPARAAPARWADEARGSKSGSPVLEERSVSFGLLLMLGLMLFALFFVLGFILQPLPFGR